MVLRLDQIGALATHRHRLVVAMRPECARRSLRRLLAGALERIELLVADPGVFVGKSHWETAEVRSQNPVARS